MLPTKANDERCPRDSAPWTSDANGWRWDATARMPILDPCNPGTANFGTGSAGRRSESDRAGLSNLCPQMGFLWIYDYNYNYMTYVCICICVPRMNLY
jgi:hypothetical protein